METSFLEFKFVHRSQLHFFCLQITKPFFAAITDEKVQQKLLCMLFDLLVNCKNSHCSQTVSSVFKGVSCKLVICLLIFILFQVMPCLSLLPFVIPLGSQIFPLDRIIEKQVIEKCKVKVVSPHHYFHGMKYLVLNGNVFVSLGVTYLLGKNRKEQCLDAQQGHGSLFYLIQAAS